MKSLCKITVGLLITLFLVGCYSSPNYKLLKGQDNSHNNISNSNDSYINLSPELIEDLNYELKNRLIQETDENKKVIMYDSKKGLINYLSEIMNEKLTTNYIDTYYYEKQDGLYLIPKETPITLDLNKDYKLERQSKYEYYAVQETTSELHGNYEITMHFKYVDNHWIIDASKVSRDRLAQENMHSIVLLVNKDNPLSSDYIPPDLTTPNVNFTFEEDLPKRKLRKVAADALEKMFTQAKKDNIELYAFSGYRSYDRQEAIFTYYTKKLGEDKADTFSARPGKSEHQTGLAMDVTAASVDYGMVESFGETEEGKWLKENAHTYGFIIRYPKGKESITGYQYEPWHVRYVGREVAEYLSVNDITLEEYFISDLN